MLYSYLWLLLRHVLSESCHRIDVQMFVCIIYLYAVEHNDESDYVVRYLLFERSHYHEDLHVR